jgi:thiosulfate reductase cytochrome b subunit
MTQRDNFKYLTIALTLLLFCTALCHQFFAAKLQHTMQACTMFTLFVSVWGVDSNNLFFKQKLLFPLIIIACSWLTLVIDNTLGDNMTLLLMLVFFLDDRIQNGKASVVFGSRRCK